MDVTRSKLGDFLRSRRERLNPNTAGISDGRRRRTPGLRREEVAELAGIGVDWYMKLEQGRFLRPSQTTTEALARALCLGEAEYAHLKALACCEQRSPFVDEVVPEGLRRLVQSLPHPAYITGLRWDLLAWNVAAEKLFTPHTPLPKENQNILVYMFLEAQSRHVFAENWADEAKRIAALFRTTFDLWSHDPTFIRLINRLRSSSLDFTRIWDMHEVQRGCRGRKALRAATDQLENFDCVTFQANESPSLKLVTYSPAC